MELTTLILNINQGYNEKLMKTCQTLGQYTELVSRIRKHQKDMVLEEAVTCAIDECIFEGILADFLQKNRREAIRVSVLECKVEDVMELLQKEAKEEGFAEGRAEGLAERHAEGEISALIASVGALAKNMNLDPVQAMDVLNISEEDREIILREIVAGK